MADWLGSQMAEPLVASTVARWADWLVLRRAVTMDAYWVGPKAAVKVEQMAKTTVVSLESNLVERMADKWVRLSALHLAVWLVGRSVVPTVGWWGTNWAACSVGSLGSCSVGQKVVLMVVRMEPTKVAKTATRKVDSLVELKASMSVVGWVVSWAAT